MDGFSGTPIFDHLTAECRAAIMQNARFFKASTLSADPFPPLVERAGQAVAVSLYLIVTGEHTIKIHQLVNEELARLLPHAAQTTIPKAGHGAARENPQAFNEAVLHFLAHHQAVNQTTIASRA